MDINDYKPKFDKVIEHLKVELSGIRTNRISPALVEGIKVSAYEGSPEQLLKELAAITVPEARQLLVEPWDKSIIKTIEKAVEESRLSFSVSNEGAHLRLTMPDMTDEVRAQVKKLLSEKLEAARVGVRQQREATKELIVAQEKAKEIGEDEKFRLIEKLDELSKEYTDKIKELGEVKEKEISA